MGEGGRAGLFARLERDLALGAVLVEAGERVEVALVEARGLAGGDHGVGVARVAHDNHLAVLVSDVVECLALLDEDLAVEVLQQLKWRGRAREGR